MQNEKNRTKKYYKMQSSKKPKNKLRNVTILMDI